jgi:hypothetical protein
MNLLLGGRGRWAALGAIAGALTVGGIAWADIPDSGVINGCYKTNGGVLRVIDASAGDACNPSEQPVSWSQTGPTGATGPIGPRGPAGPPGLSLFANVTSDGILVSGTATATSHPDTGIYFVGFGRDVSNCAAVATTGFFPGDESATLGVVATTGTFAFQPHDVEVFLRRGDDFIENPFHLVVAC